jgi:hypothetical protein
MNCDVGNFKRIEPGFADGIHYLLECIIYSWSPADINSAAFHWRLDVRKTPASSTRQKLKLVGGSVQDFLPVTALLDAKVKPRRQKDVISD